MAVLSIDFTQGLDDAWSKIAQFVPKLAGFLVILAIGWFVSKMIGRVLDRVLRKAGSERLAERAGVDRMLLNSAHDLTGIVCRIVYWTLMLITLQLALGVLGPNPVSTMINELVAWLPRAVVAVILIVVAMAIANAVRTIVASALSGVSYGPTVAGLVWGAIVALGAVAALGQAGIATTVTQPMLYAVLATVTGILIVGVGGGMIRPMRHRWERWLDTAEQEAARTRGVSPAYQAGPHDAWTTTAERDAEGQDRRW
ncbi:TM helix repeat-containing protein [Streptomyces davaonensis JCM 4913]|uniref:TM helix repeat-containing protein n=1 Tax=Streptomyces davaonensis (strain DSM 101723 / JCM 4913 / KCC S-0913 / 768) TaxID=1214101 RepID=K4QX78_STRDJ|nr:TM helix repeat-containing protein [Streptomyces davaonensis]CCK25653.1 TM helix repeat-containing protein [Streptomyces davaonensis JCM 4913]